jgi:hypothetical protein
LFAIAITLSPSILVKDASVTALDHHIAWLHHIRLYLGEASVLTLFEIGRASSPPMR